MQPCTNARGWGKLNGASIFIIQLLIRPPEKAVHLKMKGYFWQLDNFFLTMTHWNQMCVEKCVCVCVRVHHASTRTYPKANPKEYMKLSILYISSYIKVYIYISGITPGKENSGYNLNHSHGLAQRDPPQPRCWRHLLMLTPGLI